MEEEKRGEEKQNRKNRKAEVRYRKGGEREGENEKRKSIVR